MAYLLQKQNPIAVFDSGVGGISVLRELVKIMPQEDYIYFGDSKNAPYGMKDQETVRRLAINCAVALTVEVEVGVVGQIDDSLPVTPGSQSQLKGILIAPHVMGYHFQIAGIAGLSVLRKIHELHGIPFDTALPDLVLETVGTAVQMVGTIVHGQFVRCTAAEAERLKGQAQ